MSKRRTKHRQPFIQTVETITPLLTPRQIRAGLLAAVSSKRRAGGPDRAIVERLLTGRYWLPVARWDVQPELLTAQDIERMFSPWFLGLQSAIREPKRFKWQQVKSAGRPAVATFEAHWHKTTKGIKPEAWIGELAA